MIAGAGGPVKTAEPGCGGRDTGRMADVDTLVLFSRDAPSRRALTAAADRRGLRVVEPAPTPQALVAVTGPGVAARVPGGLAAQALAAGADLRLSGPDAAWFTALGPAVTGRVWHRVDPAGARSLLARGPAFVKLADLKHPALPARRHPDAASLDTALSTAGLADVALLATHGWLDIDSEYRTFTRGRDVLTVSAYRVQDEPWSPLLHTSRASFHDEAAAFVAEVLRDLPDDAVPPAAVVDVARLTGGRLVVLEVNQSWGAGLYGCDPDAVLASVIAASGDHPDRWRWRPDPAAVAPV